MTLSSERTSTQDAWRDRAQAGDADVPRESGPAAGAADAGAVDTGADLTAHPPLVDPELLARSDKILFIAHLALGDFTYLQSCFAAFARAFPHIKIHLWVDERRRTRKAADWPHLKKYALYDWLAACPYFDKVYTETYSPATFDASVREAQREAYPIVVSLAELERHKYALLARKISPDGFVAGQKKRVRKYDLYKRFVYGKLDASIRALTLEERSGRHISDIYAGWFAQLFGLAIAPAERYPVLSIPPRWMQYARDQFAAWGFSASAGATAPKVVFLNAYSKSIERTWPLERVIELIRTMRRDAAWRDTGFVVNVVPEDLVRARAVFADANLERTHLFSAEDNFFQLPAILSLCTLIVSVETAVMHLANAVHVPVIALMRQKNPEWAPIDKRNSTIITVARRDDWVDKIGVDAVMAVLAQQPA